MHRIITRFLAAASAVLLVPSVGAAAPVMTPRFLDGGRQGPTRMTTDSADVAGVVNAFHRALAAGDSASAMALLAADAIIQESGGVETRSDYAGHHLPGDMRFAQALPGVRSAQRVIVAGDVAWSTSTSATKGRYRERDINSVGAELMVLSRVAGVWRIRAIHWSSRTPRS